MIKIFKLSFYLIFLFVLSCSSQQNTIIENNETPEYLYKLAMIDLDDKKYDLAQSKFKDIEYKFPLSNEAIQSQIMDAFIDYLKMNYEESIFKFSKIIKKYPSHKNMDYVYYMKAMCYYEQIDSEYLDGENNIKALENFNQVINRFPNSKYSKDSQQKVIFVRENIAAKHMNVAKFYINQKKYLAAMKRYKIIIDEHPKSKFVPEALFRLVEIYYSLGIIDDAKKTASVIGYNYPESKWYKYSYDLVGDEDEKKEKKSFLSKLLNKDEKNN